MEGGILKNEDGIFEGEFKNDLKEGKGKMIDKNKWDGIFEGEWKKGINYGGIRIIYGNLYTESLGGRKIGRKAGRFCDAKGNEFGRIDNEGNFYDEKRES